MKTHSTRSKAVRDPIKHAFMDSLTGAERDYLRSRKKMPVRVVIHEPAAKEIIAKAREAGVYQPKTIDMDVMSGLTNFITRQ